MGVVYRARDTLLERTVALKVIGTSIEGNPELRDRFFREARAAGQLSHRNIITIHDLGEHEGQPYLAMEFLIGEDLQRRLQRPEPMSLARKLEIASEVSEGLSFAHRRGLIHRDIKPANIFITDDGVVKILDFGLARMMGSEMTASNMMFGTVNYMAPEQVRGERTDHRSDIFSLGVLLYELLSGKRAFQADSFATTLYKILQDVPESLLNIDPTLPHDVVRIVEKAMAKARDERYQDLTDLTRDLAIVRQLLSSGDAVTMAVPGSGPHRVPSDPPRSAAAAITRPPSAPPALSGQVMESPAPSWRKWVPLAAGVALLLAVGGAAAWWTLRDREAPAGVQAPGPSAPRTDQPAAPPAVTPPELPPSKSAEGTKPSPPPSVAEQASQRAASEARTRMSRAKSAARQARGAERSITYGAALTAEREGQRLYQAGQYSEAAAKFYEASGLFHSAELSASGTVPPSPVEVPRPSAPAPGGTAPVAPPPAGPARTSQSPATQPPASPPPATQSPSPPPAAGAPGANPPPAERAAPPPATVPSPAPVPPATRTTPPPPSLPSESPRALEEGVRELLRRYEQALEGRNIEVLKRLWPGLQGAQEEAIRREFMFARRIDVTIEGVDVTVSGTTATARFIRRYQILTVDGQRPPTTTTRTTLSARRTGNDWLIDHMSFEAIR
jgi:serine/threonine-protein kinase